MLPASKSSSSAPTRSPSRVADLSGVYPLFNKGWVAQGAELPGAGAASMKYVSLVAAVVVAISIVSSVEGYW